jgi:hypothetical protein
MYIDEYKRKKEIKKMAEIFVNKVYNKPLIVESLKFKIGLTFTEEMPEFFLRHVEQTLNEQIYPIMTQTIQRMQEDVKFSAEQSLNEYKDMMIDAGLMVDKEE